MASTKQFKNVPPFPARDVPVAAIETISLADLRSGDGLAGQKLLASCQELGFLMLDLNADDAGRAMMDVIDQLFDLGQKLFSLPEDEKQEYLHDIPKSFLGFKPRGVAKTETGEPDRFQWFNIGRDGVAGLADLQPLPPVISPHLELLRSFFKHGQEIVDIIFTILASQLGLPANTFAALQSPKQQSGTVLRLIKSFASPPDGSDLRTSMIHHTDFGSITLLANVLGGLQILTPGREASDARAWQWVQPQPGCLVVNLGDAMVQWTGGLLRSNVHRVYHAPGAQRFVDRYSLGLLVRPNRDASMNPLTGEGEKTSLTAWEWEVKQFMALHRGDAEVESKGGETAGSFLRKEKGSNP